MNREIVFKLFFGALFISAVLVTVINQRRAGNYSRGMASHARSHARHEATGLLAIRGALALLWYPTVLAWLFAPQWIKWSFLDIPVVCRSAGAAVSVGGVALLFWGQRSAGKNFAPTLEMKDDHQLITHGAYRWVRHPIYLAFLLMISGSGIVARNWFMELTGILLIGFVMLLRIPREETLLAERFGEQYTAYRKRTPSLVPLT